MTSLLHDIFKPALETCPGKCAIRISETAVSFEELADTVGRIAAGLTRLGLAQGDRIAVFLPNSLEFVVTSLAASTVGAIFVPINPLQRPQQIHHILDDCNARVLVTAQFLLSPLLDTLSGRSSVGAVVLCDRSMNMPAIPNGVKCLEWDQLGTYAPADVAVEIQDNDPVAILYTSGSSGRAKGVVLSHANLTAGAKIVSSYLENRSTDVILAALPLSFDYGYSQVTTALHVGAEVVLTNYSMPRRLLAEISRYNATCLAGVPTMWNQLSAKEWPAGTGQKLRYITNSGGKIPGTVLQRLRTRLPQTEIFLMYGLTECFRSTYLPPSEIDRRPDSIGKAVPGENVLVVRDDGKPCQPGEPGELIHHGSLVSLGYWNNPTATAKRFRPFEFTSGQGRRMETVAVWSGDVCETDEDGFIYFVGRSDAMIKASGYRISPEEVEEIVFSTGLVNEVVAVGLPDEMLGQKVALAVVPRSAQSDIDFALRSICAREMPPYMQPGEIVYLEDLRKTPNGKPDRTSIASMLMSIARTS